MVTRMRLYNAWNSGQELKPDNIALRFEQAYTPQQQPSPADVAMMIQRLLATTEITEDLNPAWEREFKETTPPAQE